MDELADMMINEGWNADEIMDATGMNEEELAERYLENWYTIKEAAEETWADTSSLIEEFLGVIWYCVLSYLIPINILFS